MTAISTETCRHCLGRRHRDEEASESSDREETYELTDGNTRRDVIIRTDLSSNGALSSGTTMLAGIGGRVARELTALAPSTDIGTYGDQLGDPCSCPRVIAQHTTCDDDLWATSPDILTSRCPVERRLSNLETAGPRDPPCNTSMQED